MTPAHENIPRIAIVGASGFIGRHLVSGLLRNGQYEVSVLSRNRKNKINEGWLCQGVKVFEGDLGDADSLKGFLVPGCTVINLMYLWHAGTEKNMACMHNLLAACQDAQVKRLIHCSTAAVAGRSPHDLIDEQTECLPISEYGETKLKIEQEIIDSARNHFDSVILRPTSVFGIDGDPLKKLAADISKGNGFRNYLKSCLFGCRRMNLVPVANVIAAIIFIAQHSGRLQGEIFILSEDDDPKNNFIEVERFLRNALGVGDYLLPRIPLPLVVLKLLLMLKGRNNVNPHCNFDSSKIRKLGFTSPQSLAEGLAEYATWYRVSNESGHQ